MPPTDYFAKNFSIGFYRVIPILLHIAQSPIRHNTSTIQTSFYNRPQFPLLTLSNDVQQGPSSSPRKEWLAAYRSSQFREFGLCSRDYMESVY